MGHSLILRTLSCDDILSHIFALSDVLINCVEGGASVSFMSPLSRDSAIAFWQRTASSVAASERIVLVAENEQHKIVGTVQLITDQPENQPHRADVAKLLVHEAARRDGVGRALMMQLENIAREAGKNVLVLDTATGSGAETFYQHNGWQKAGEIPRYALLPGGELTATSVFYKLL
ncbi:GNAT family N-acetyltransferase [Pseudocitrobacter cyperus]|uniref:GNAT family N-acetyltransferase n=1 Tax=Pseudocitrobacter cyperus TaxID=3112843 RepID=A0ABV0HDW0_9ENTR